MHSIFIIIGIILLGIILSLIYIPRITQPRRLDSSFKFLLTLLATLAGVFLAFQISNYQEMQQEKDFLQALLEQSTSGLETDIEFIQTNYLPYLESEGDITEFEQLINTHPLYGNISLSIMLNSTLLPKFASASYAEINSLAFELETDRDSINAREVDPNLRLELIEPYLQDLQYLKEFLLIEIAYVQGNISNEQAQIEYNRLKSD